MSDRKNKTEQLLALRLDMGMQYLANEGYRIIGNPIVIHDMDYRLIAHTENIVTDDPIWLEITTTGTISRERQEFYKNEKFLDAAANAKKITYLLSDKLKYERILGKLLNGDNVQIGVASIEAHHPFDDDIMETFELFCDIVNRSIAGSAYYRAYGQAYQEALIIKLIEGDIEDRGIYAAHVESIYMNLKDDLFLAVVDIPQRAGAQHEPSYFRDIFKQAQPAFKYAVYRGQVVIILSSDKATLHIERDFRKLYGLFEQYSVSIGISSGFGNLYELNKYYKEAVNCIEPCTEAR